MRRFSKRNSLVTLNEINITPLLDLAFVLLRSFIITRPMLDNSMQLNLPKGGEKPGKIEAKDRMTVEISPQGLFRLNGKPMKLDPMLEQMKNIARGNPNAYVAIRTDETAQSKHVFAIINGCQKKGIEKFQLMTLADK